MPQPFRFKQFLVEQYPGVHPVGTDGVLLGAWADIGQARTILDVGTGTGLVALMLAQRSKQATICGVDIQEAACVCARDNFARSPWSDRLVLVEQSVQDHARSAGARYDLIVSNPPFFSETTRSPDQSRRLSRSAESLSLFSLLEAAHLLLVPDGRFCAVLPYREGVRLLEQAALTGLYCTRETRVYGKAGKPLERLLLQLERNPYPFQRTELVLTEPDGSYSRAFRDMTDAFYLSNF